MSSFLIPKSFHSLTHTTRTHKRIQVLKFLTAVYKSSPSTVIKPYGSQSIQLSLLKPPHRLLNAIPNSPVSTAKEDKDVDVLIFCLPTTADYLRQGTNG